MTDDRVFGKRLILHEQLKEIIGNSNVYFKAPPGVKMNYPAIRYELSRVIKQYANNSPYAFLTPYELTLITTTAENPYIDKILSLPYTEFDRRYVADNLTHDVVTIYI